MIFRGEGLTRLIVTPESRTWDFRIATPEGPYMVVQLAPEAASRLAELIVDVTRARRAWASGAEDVPPESVVVGPAEAFDGSLDDAMQNAYRTLIPKEIARLSE